MGKVTYNAAAFKIFKLSSGETIIGEVVQKSSILSERTEENMQQSINIRVPMIIVRHVNADNKETINLIPFLFAEENFSLNHTVILNPYMIMSAGTPFKNVSDSYIGFLEKFFADEEETTENDKEDRTETILQ